MKSIQRKAFWMAVGVSLTLPTAGHSASVTLADQPLWLGTSVKHNVILAIDDSGSMDFETLFDNNDGALYLNSNGFLADLSGNLYSSGEKYTYLFPNGYSSSYDGRKLYSSSQYALPPKKPYAFARSADYNKAYYDPNEEYLPWPSYGGYVYSDVSTTATPFEPLETGLSTRTLNLFTDLSTASNGSEWGFDIRDGDMICDDAGNTCLTGEKHYTYYPATYYVKDTTSTYTYDVSVSSGVNNIDTSTSVLLEAEDGTIVSPISKNTDLTGTSGFEATALGSATLTASNNLFVGSYRSTVDSYNTPPSSGNLSLSFSKTGTANIWLRIYAPDGDTDSFWVNLVGYDSSTVTDLVDTFWDGDWHRFRDGVGNSSSWRWVKWGQAVLTSGTHTLNIKHREGGTYLDQVLVTTDTGFVPSGVLANPTIGGVPRNCATETSPAHYQDFVVNPGRFSGVDAIGIDGSCLKKYVIAGSDGDAFTNGSTNRPTGIVNGAEQNTVADEKQNFANWFTYYRKRHQAMRGGLASAFQGVGGIRTGIFWFNDRSDVTMHDMDSSTGVSNFLDEHYQHVQSGGTPLRTALKYAGDQYKRTGTGAPITEECQKNFTLLFTDGFTSSSDFSISGIGNEDGTAGAPYQDTLSDTAADIAYKYYTDNLRTDITPVGKVNIPEACSNTPLDSSLDCNSNLHMNTYTVGLGAKGTVYGVTHNTVADAYTTAPTWPDVNAARDQRQIDDLYHTAVNGRGDMFNADTPQQLNTELTSALRDIIEQIGSGSGVTFNTSSLQNESLIFTTLFNSPAWNGDLIANSLNSTTGAVIGKAWSTTDGSGNTVEVGAAGVLDARNLTTDPRVILTNGATDGVAFQWTSLTTAQKDDLKSMPSGETGTDTVSHGEMRLNFLRGDRTNESGVLRTRSSRMGDVINSAPVYVGVPASGWPDKDGFGIDGNRYSDFKNRTLANGGAEDRTPVIYVGSNDGMLHGFNALASSALGGGKELMAYIPAKLFSSSAGKGLHFLTDPNYVHNNYVDLTPVAQDIYIDPNASGTKDWLTMLVGGLRGGGRGIFALDVTNPAAFSETVPAPANTVLWEFTNDDDDDMGYITSTPIITLMENGKWAVIFGNGYGSSNGLAKLFILFAEEGVDGTWTSSSDYVEVSTGVGSLVAGNENGLSGVSVADMDGNGKADRVYAGDLQGNMWAFNLSSSNTNSWKVAHLSGSTPEPLFVAEDSAGKAQPITGAPNLAFNTEVPSGGAPNVLVTFGTGQYLASGDQTNTDVQSYYTVWDQGTATLDRSDLAPRTLVQTGTKISISGAPVNWGSESGWYFDFDLTGEEGERLTHKPLLASDADLGPVAIFATIVPESSACSGGGHSGLYAISLFTGLNPDKAIFDLGGDGKITNAGEVDSSGVAIPDDIGVGERKGVIVNIPNKLGKYIYGSEGKGNNVDITETTLGGGSGREGRLGWHELLD